MARKQPGRIDAVGVGSRRFDYGSLVQAELASVRGELTVSQQENQNLQMQLAEKERTLQATKADLIETRLELQRTEARLTVRCLSLPHHAMLHGFTVLSCINALVSSITQILCRFSHCFGVPIFSTRGTWAACVSMC